MQLAKAVVDGYRSIRAPLEFHVDPRVTVVLGANDHGKTNLLDALVHLNEPNAFTEDDLNWDCDDRADELPYARFDLRLADSDREELARLHNVFTALEEIAAIKTALETDLNDARKDVNSATQQVKKASEAVDSAAAEIEALDSESTATERKAATTNLNKLKRQLTESAKSRDNHQSRLSDLETSFAVVSAQETRLNAELAGDSVDGALQITLKAAHRSVSQAGAAAKAARAELRTASEAHTLAESEGQSQEVIDRHLATVNEMERTVTLAERQKERASQRHAQLKRDIELLKKLDQGDKKLASVAAPLPQPREAASMPAELSVERRGVDSPRTHLPVPDVRSEAITRVIEERMPRVELIRPFERIPDAVTLKQLTSDDDFVFMRGIFHYAGLAEAEWPVVFEQTARTARRLEDASERLNTTLKRSWSQGESLTFKLDHNSAQRTIELQIKDPAVTRTFVRPSRRSSGFTHFFALKTILNALQSESPAASYLWLFDEPGIHLHPDGQYDLIQVMETLAQTNQAIYTTHSIFMANKNYPVRHRLIHKSAKGTRMDGKPFRSRWKPALDHLGLSLTGSLLFASRVLLVEGDSDAILLNAVLHKLLEAGRFEHDVNPLAIMATGDAQNTHALVRILLESTDTAPKLALLFDSDEGGKKRAKSLEKLAKEKKIPTLLLDPDKTTTEDHLILAASLFPQAVTEYLAEIAPAKTAEEYAAKLNDSLAPCISGAAPVGLASWSREEGKRVAELDEEPSSTGIARKYAQLLDAIPAEDIPDDAFAGAQAVIAIITGELELPPLVLDEGRILTEDEPE